MNEHLLNIIRSILPQSIRIYLGEKYWNHQWHYQWKHVTAPMIQNYYKEHPTKDKEILDILPNLQKFSNNAMFPYEWAKKPHFIHLNIYIDSEKNLKYVNMDNKKLYFPMDWNDRVIKSYYHAVQIIEQHPSSPHCYLTSSFNISSNDIAVDLGSAEGNWGLSIVERVKKLYIFEPEDKWIEPLKATFSKWQDKVVIVKKFISNYLDDNTTTIDDYFKDKEPPTLFKIDIEGYEKSALLGGKKILSENSSLKAVVCTYHKREDEEELTNVMKDYGFTITHSDGYMIFVGHEISPPYFRRGVIRCTKS